MGDAPAAIGSLARRDLLIGGACCAAAVLANSAPLWSAPRPLPAGGLDALVPKQLGGWSLASSYGVVVAEEGEGEGEGVRRRGPYDDLLTRIYQSATAPPVTLLVAYVGSQRADVRLHRPEACYPAAGFALSDRELVQLKFGGIPPISAQMLFAKSPMGSEQLLYWTRVGREFPTSNVAQLGAFVRENLAGSAPDGILMRLSVPGANRARARVTLHAFLTALLASTSPDGRRVLFGGPA